MIFKKHHKVNYTCISNELIKDTRLSNKSLGLMVKMLSLPDDWDFSIAGLAAICKDQTTSVSSSLDELKELGYVKVEPYRQGGRIVDWIYNIYETPIKVGAEPEKEEEVKEGVKLNQVKQSKIDKKLEEERIKKEKRVKKEEEKERISEATDTVIEYLNQKASTKFTNCDTNFNLIKSLLRQKYTVDDIKLVIDAKCFDWLCNKDMKPCLRPVTLFGDKFDSYLSAAKVKKDATFDPSKINTKRVFN